MKRNFLGLVLAMLVILVFGNMSFAQDCKNGKCPLQGQGVVVPKGFAQGPSCQGGNCPLPGKSVTIIKGSSGGCNGCTGGCSGGATSSFKSSTVTTGTHKGLFHRIRDRRNGN